MYSYSRKDVDRAEDLAPALEDTITSMRRAIDEIQGSDSDYVDDVVDTLNDLIHDLQLELSECNEILDREAREELDYMNREYERSVI